MGLRHLHPPLFIDLHMHHRGDVADEAAVRGDAEALACGQAPAPAGLVGGQLDDVAQPAGVDGEVLVGLAVVPERLRQPRSEEHTPELQSLMRISYAVFCLKKKISLDTA